MIHIDKNGKKLGPYLIDDINELIKSGRLEAMDLAWKEGLSDWVPLWHIQGIKFQAVPPPDQFAREMPKAHGLYFVKATRGQRFVNVFLDTVLLYFPMKAWAFIALNYEINIKLVLLVNFVMFLGYYTFFEWGYGKTFGKLITKTKVINEGGSRPNFSTTIKRTLCRCIPFENVSFLRKNIRGWHDSFSKTYVVKNK